MPSTKGLKISDLTLDLNNYRTVPQKNEHDAIETMLSISSKKFIGVLTSILDFGFLATENLLIEHRKDSFIVREGNRRVACLKLIHKIHDPTKFSIPGDLVVRIQNLSESWLNENSLVPCIIYNQNELDQVEKVINLLHAKGEAASRDPWTSVARARRNRDHYGTNAPALDVLEKFLSTNKTVNDSLVEEWSGDYPVTVLDEAIKKIAPRVGCQNSVELARNYKKLIKKYKLDQLVIDIGYKNLRFPDIRGSQTDFAQAYQIPENSERESGASADSEKETGGDRSNPTGSGASTNGNNDGDGDNSNTKDKGGNNNPSTGSSNGTRTNSTTPSGKDAKFVRQTLKKFNPIGVDRQKVVELRDEMIKVTLNRTPLAFCFLLRSAFEISAKGYFKDHNLKITKNSGRDKNLTEMLREITDHLSNGKKDKNMLKQLHGAMSNLAESDRILSVTSMNQLVHNPNFSITSTDVVTMFGNVFPLLEKMNS